MRKKKNKERRPQLSKREYDRLRRVAKDYIVNKGKEQKWVAELLNVTEVTISNWSNKDPNGTWKEQREARMQCKSTDAENQRKLVGLLSKRRLSLEERIIDASNTGETEEEERLRKEARGLSDEIRKESKTLETLEKKDYSLGTFIDIMDEIFNGLRQHDEDLWERTVEFQSTIVRKKANELG